MRLWHHQFKCHQIHVFRDKQILELGYIYTSKYIEARLSELWK